MFLLSTTHILSYLCIKNEGIVVLAGPEPGADYRNSSGPRSGHYLDIVRLRAAWEPFYGVSPRSSLKQLQSVKQSRSLSKVSTFNS